MGHTPSNLTPIYFLLYNCPILIPSVIWSLSFLEANFLLVPFVFLQFLRLKSARFPPLLCRPLLCRLLPTFLAPPPPRRRLPFQQFKSCRLLPISLAPPPPRRRLPFQHLRLSPSKQNTNDIMFDGDIKSNSKSYEIPRSPSRHFYPRSLLVRHFYPQLTIIHVTCRRSAK